ncbi:tetratricopeptide repeat protein [Heliophilum fasciatum]|uniref:Uncharacterized protein n=1 Tax=Heliophilum fasciatum TaxID=35700 RepID=A0A4R2RAJ5_9FIRM|nr:hypothetical protein [Heliophilum fasciatum]MCW2279331.1 tetratricopeptide (TPR) repeat protein [Heliophilum fasciatum]TCP60312.1 hypothetical protein EDD73_13911 [Heliophilum fasciatum]
MTQSTYHLRGPSNPEYVLGRNVWGVLRPLPSQIPELAQRAMAQMERLKAPQVVPVEQEADDAPGDGSAGGGFLVITYGPGQQAVALLLLLRLATELKRRDDHVWVQEAAPVHPDDLPAAKRCIVLLQRPDGEFFSEPGVVDGRIILFACARHDWERIRLAERYELVALDQHSDRERSHGEAKEQSVLDDMVKRWNQAGEAGKKVFFYTALLDSLGILLSSTLLERLLGHESEQALREAVAMGLVFQADDEAESDVFWTTRGETLARRMLDADRLFSELAIRSGYGQILAALDADAPADRRLAWRLWQELLHRGWRSRGLALMDLAWAQIERLEVAAAAGERLMLAKTLESYRCWKKALAVLERAVVAFPDDHRLLHRKARLLAEWSLVDPAQVPAAEAAFQRAAAALGRTPYLVHAWAEWKRRQGDPPGALVMLDDLEEQIALGEQTMSPASSMYFWITRAKAWMDMARRSGKDGDHRRAQAVLMQAEKAAATASERAYVLHVAADLAVDRGQIDEAQRQLTKVLDLFPEQAVALTTMAVLQGKRGHWQAAAAYLARVRKIDCENLYACHQQAKMLAEQATLLAVTKPAQAALYRAQASAQLAEVLRLDPWNIPARVDAALLLMKEKNLTLADASLTEVLMMQPGNVFASLVRVRLALLRGEQEEARRLLQRCPEKSAAWHNSWIELYGAAGHERRRHKESQAHFRQALRLSSGVDRIVTINHWAKAIAADADIVEGGNDDAVALRWQEQPEAAKDVQALLTESLRLDGENAYTLWLCSWIHPLIAVAERSRAEFREQALQRGILLER